ncbi:MAG: DUF86 domain-containing protein [Elusimicrobiota bacterium]|nr:DUF86 domain-containing protein [Elusimicrobiota bacterium]
MVDKEIVRTHLKYIERNLKVLQNFRNFSIEELTDVEKEWMVERGLQVTIQSIIDIGTHILASLAVNKIETYRDVMIWLGKKEIIHERLAKSLAKMAGFRNILVHGYLDIDIRKVWNVLRRNLTDFRRYCEYIYKYIE